jgi:hypothetical protein
LVGALLTESRRLRLGDSLPSVVGWIELTKAIVQPSLRGWDMDEDAAAELHEGEPIGLLAVASDCSLGEAVCLGEFSLGDVVF